MGRRLGAGARAIRSALPRGRCRWASSTQGAFESDDDLDHVLFSVANPGSTLQFVVTNTYGGCDRNNYCPIWGTLLDTAGGQLGGEGSGAGTGPVGRADQRLRSSGPFRRRATTSSSWRETAILATYRFRGDVTNAGAGGGGGGRRRRARPPDHPPALGRPPARDGGPGPPDPAPGGEPGDREAGGRSGRRFGRSRAVRVGYLRRGGRGPGAVSLRVPLLAHVRRAMASLKSLRVTLVVTVTRGGSRPIVLRLPVLLKPPLR